MGDYVEKLKELVKKGDEIESVTENIYLNYHSTYHTDEVYKLRKALAIEYGCDLNSVKLIGSAHTGYTFKNDRLELRKEPNDYDFAIISPVVFTRVFHEISVNDMNSGTKKNFVKWILCGKIHPRYADETFLKKIQKSNNTIMKQMGVKKHISICFYLSEKDFIDGLVNYNRKIYSYVLKDLNEKDEKTFGVTIAEIANLTDIKPLDKLED